MNKAVGNVAENISVTSYAADAAAATNEAERTIRNKTRIDKETWEIIGTGFQNIVPDDEDEGVPQNGTGVPKAIFSENLLRNIIDLHPDQSSYLRGKRYNAEKLTKADAGAIGGSSKDQNDLCLPESTADRLATEYKVSAGSVQGHRKINAGTSNSEDY